MPYELIAALVLAVGGPVAAALLNRWRRRRARASGRPVRYPCRLAAPAATGGSYPSALSRGALLVDDTAVVWRGRDGLRLDLTRTGLVAVRRRPPSTSDADVLLVCQDGCGTELHLEGSVDHLEDLRDVLRARPLPDRPHAPAVLRPARTAAWAVGPVLALTASLLLSAGLAGLFVTATPVLGTVVDAGSAEDPCTVEWALPGTGDVRRNGVDCYGDVGDRERYYALAGPLRGELVFWEDPWWWAGVSAVLVTGSLVSLVVVARRHRLPIPRSGRGTSPRPTAGSVPALTPDRCDLPSLAAHARLRARAEGWSFEGHEAAADLQQVPRYLRSDRAMALAALAAPLAGVVVAGALVLLIGWPAFTGLATSWQPTATATARVEGEPYEMVPFGPAEVDVRFRDAAGRARTAVVVLASASAVPDTMPVRYATARPEHARALRSDGTALALGIGGIVVGAALAYAGWRTVQVLQVRRDERVAAAMPPRELDHVLLHSVDSECVLVLARPGSSGAPDRALVLAHDVRGTLPGTGRITLRGPDEPGSAVVAAHRGQPLVLASPLLGLDRDELLALANGTDLDDEPEPAQPKKTSASS